MSFHMLSALISTKMRNIQSHKLFTLCPHFNLLHENIRNFHNFCHNMAFYDKFWNCYLSLLNRRFLIFVDIKALSISSKFIELFIFDQKAKLCLFSIVKKQQNCFVDRIQKIWVSIIDWQKVRQHKFVCFPDTFI